MIALATTFRHNLTQPEIQPLKETIEEKRLAAWQGLLKAHARCVAAIDRDLREAGQVPLEHYDVLLELFNSDNHRLRLADLADKVVLSRSGLTRLVDRLAQEGLLERVTCASDGRGRYAVLTARGEQAFRSAWPIYASGIRAHFGDLLKDEEAETIGIALLRVAKVVQEQPDPSAPRS